MAHGRACEIRRVMKALDAGWRIMLQNGRGTVSGALVIIDARAMLQGPGLGTLGDNGDGIKWAVLMSQWVHIARDG